MAESKMAKPIYIIGACAFAAVAFFVVAQRASAPHRSPLEATAATTITTMSPLEMMIRYDKSLPVENWDAS
jgi:hypothetical protein